MAEQSWAESAREESEMYARIAQEAEDKRLTAALEEQRIQRQKDEQILRDAGVPEKHIQETRRQLGLRA